jgi:hypothetical protein
MLRIKKERPVKSSEKQEYEKPIDKRLKSTCKEFCVAMGLKHELMKHNYDYNSGAYNDYVKTLIINTFKRIILSDLKSVIEKYPKKYKEFSYTDLFDLYKWIRPLVDNYDLSDMGWFFYGNQSDRKGYIESKRSQLLDSVYLKCPEHLQDIYNNVCLITGRAKDWGDQDQ